jgi:hypothetical protein
MAKIRITIRKDGTQKIEALETQGEGCLKLTEGFEKRLGTVIGERTLKPEFHEEPAEIQKDHEVEQ